MSPSTEGTCNPDSSSPSLLLGWPDRTGIWYLSNPTPAQLDIIVAGGHDVFNRPFCVPPGLLEAAGARFHQDMNILRTEHAAFGSFMDALDVRGEEVMRDFGPGKEGAQRENGIPRRVQFAYPETGGMWVLEDGKESARYQELTQEYLTALQPHSRAISELIQQQADTGGEEFEELERKMNRLRCVYLEKAGADFYPDPYASERVRKLVPSASRDMFKVAEGSAN